MNVHPFWGKIKSEVREVFLPEEMNKMQEAFFLMNDKIKSVLNMLFEKLLEGKRFKNEERKEEEYKKGENMEIDEDEIKNESIRIKEGYLRVKERLEIKRRRRKKHLRSK